MGSLTLILPPDIPVYGDTSYRGTCPVEDSEHITFLNMVRRAYPATWGRLMVHPQNEGKRTANRAAWDRARGSITRGAVDFILPGSPSFVCEMKRRDHTKSKWQDGQIEYLIAAQSAGAFACVALGHDAAREAFEEWRKGL